MAAFDADVAVVGLGAMGAHALWRLTARGVRAIGIEQFTPGHDQGSSHGRTRLFRVACMEHPTLPAIARRSRELWEELQPYAGGPILETCGGIMIGAPDSAVITGTLAAAQAHDLPVERLTRAQLTERFPQHADLADDDIGVWDPEAGIVHPETAITAATKAAQAAGATILTGTRVTSIDSTGAGAVIRTAGRNLTVKQAVVTAGAWLGKLVPGLPLAPIRTPMTWFAPASASAAPQFALSRFPAFIRQFADGHGIWGHGAGKTYGVKVGAERDETFPPIDPDTIERTTSPRDHELVTRLVAKALPGLNPIPTQVVTCMITDSQDGQFLLGRPGNEARLIIGGGDSGHAFKHAAGLGELLAEVATGEQPYVDTAFVSPDRDRASG
ncbi:N-methyl-L-tryptophan oxidase [Flindersiella endophytica]